MKWSLSTAPPATKSGLYPTTTFSNRLTQEECLQLGLEPRQLVCLGAARISAGADFAETLTPFLTPLGVPFGPAHQSHQDRQLRRVKHVRRAGQFSLIHRRGNNV